MNRRQFLIKNSLVSAGLIVGEEALEMFERLNYQKRLWTGHDFTKADLLNYPYLVSWSTDPSINHWLVNKGTGTASIISTEEAIKLMKEMKQHYGNQLKDYFTIRTHRS